MSVDNEIKLFEVTIPIEGTVSYIIEADNPEEALTLIRDGATGVPDSEELDWDFTTGGISDDGLCDVTEVL